MPAGMKREASKPLPYGGSFVSGGHHHHHHYQQQPQHQTSYPQMYGYPNNAGAGYNGGYNQGYQSF